MEGSSWVLGFWVSLGGWFWFFWRSWGEEWGVRCGGRTRGRGRGGRVAYHFHLIAIVIVIEIEIECIDWLSIVTIGRE